jgi:hypothetical protein
LAFGRDKLEGILDSSLLPRQYVAPRIDGPVEITGRIDDPVWRLAPWTKDFVDIEGDKKPAPRFRTRAKMVWDDRCLYIAAEMEEPHVWGTLTERDSVIFHDNDFEVFLDPDGDNHLYSEIEVNALNTVWDLLLPKPYRDGGPAVDGWDIKGLRTATHVNGTLNNPGDRDKGWTIEIAIPWSSLREIAGTPVPPRVGDGWRINFSRVEWRHEVVGGKYRKVEGQREDNWVWSPQGVVDMHQPEHWGYLWFGESRFDARSEAARQDLMRVYHAQKAFRAKHGKWAVSTAELGLPHVEANIQATDTQFEATLAGWRVTQDSRLTKTGGA